MDHSPPLAPLTTRAPALNVPSFYLTSRHSLSLRAIVLAAVVAAAVLFSIFFSLGHSRPARPDSGPGAARSVSATRGAAPNDDKDDPSQIDTIVLGDPADAPVPGRRGDHVSSVHPTIIVHLPRFGDQVGLIPDTAAGRLLYAWLAAFNKANYSALASTLPNGALASTTAAQMELREQTGGFALVSAKEVQPGVLVFRLRDQTQAANEALGTLQVRPDSNPAEIGSFSVSIVALTRKDSINGVTPVFIGTQQ